MALPIEQRNPYKGTPERPWARLRFTANDGSTMELDFFADTGNPFPIILGSQHMNRLKLGDATNVNTNFGLLEGGWLQLDMPYFGVPLLLVGFASDAVRAAANASHPDFEGIIGLPYLRLVEYGGDGNSFWLRPSTGSP
jgi:hypothetical protein